LLKPAKYCVKLSIIANAKLLKITNLVGINCVLGKVLFLLNEFINNNPRETIDKSVNVLLFS